VPFHSTTDDATKPLPDTVTVSAALPAVALFGLTLLSVGAGVLRRTGAAPLRSTTKSKTDKERQTKKVFPEVRPYHLAPELPFR
jgi:hypothetical protein